jgi:hypothetical protein
MYNCRAGDKHNQWVDKQQNYHVVSIAQPPQGGLVLQFLIPGNTVSPLNKGICLD